MKSWRWSRLGELSAWKRLTSFEGIISVVGFVGSIICLFGIAKTPDMLSIILLSLCCVLVLGVTILSCLLRADDFFVLRKGAEVCKVYVYVCRETTKIGAPLYELWLKMKHESLRWRVVSFEQMAGEMQSSFIFCNVDNPKIWKRFHKSGLHCDHCCLLFVIILLLSYF